MSLACINLVPVYHCISSLSIIASRPCLSLHLVPVYHCISPLSIIASDWNDISVELVTMSAAHHGASGGGPPSIPPFIAAAVNHELTQIKIVTIVFLIAGGVAALFRAYVRICMLRKVGADDWVMLIAFIFFVIDNTLTLVNVDAQRPFFTGQPMTTSVSTLLLVSDMRRFDGNRI